MTNEERQNELESKRRKREKELLQLKASNEMLEEAKQKVIEHYGDDIDEIEKWNKQIDIAKSDNIKRANEFLHASEQEMNSYEYHTVSNAAKEEYYRRLKNIGKTDEDLQRYPKKQEIKQENKEKKNMSSQKPKTKLSELTEKLKKLREETEKEQSDNNNIMKDASIMTEEEKSNKIDNIIVKENHIQSNTDIDLDPKFDPRYVPSYIQWDMIPLPSKGECYPHKKSSIPVAYLTAADENLITSRNLYNSGNMIDIILERKILDKSIRVADLCKGDRDAIAIWLRATAYGPEYPIIAPYNGQEIETTIDLSQIKYLDFNLKGDENGLFEYKTSNGDIIKYKILTSGEEQKLLNNNKNVSDIINRNSIVQNMTNSIQLLDSINSVDKEDVVEAIKTVQQWAMNIDDKLLSTTDNMYSTYITDRMIEQTKSINGNTDSEFIKNYIENMRAKDAYDYRQYISSNIPGVNLNITVQIPESMGGGSFETFLSIGETIFINV